MCRVTLRCLLPVLSWCMCCLGDGQDVDQWVILLNAGMLYAAATHSCVWHTLTIAGVSQRIATCWHLCRLRGNPVFTCACALLPGCQLHGYSVAVWAALVMPCAAGYLALLQVGVVLKCSQFELLIQGVKELTPHPMHVLYNACVCHLCLKH